MRRRFSTAAFPVHRHSAPQVALDAGLVALAYFLAYRLRFDGAGGVPELYHDLFVRTIGFAVIGSIAILALFGVYRHWMRYSSQSEYLRIAQASLACVLALVAYVVVVQPKLLFAPPRGFVSVNVPTGVLVLYGLLMLVFLGGARFIVHAAYERPLRGSRMRKNARTVLIVGAGDGGRLLLRELMRNPELGYRPVGFIDDDPRKQGARIDRGLEVLGTTRELGRVLDDVEPQEVLIAIPSAPGALRGKVVSACRDRGVPVRTMPTVFELLQTGGRLMRQVREVKVEDVLGREPVRMEVERVGDYLTGRCVLVTGAGGSIGSELCRQIARVGPSRLILLDHAEDNLFEIQRELVEDRHALNTVAVLADCKAEERMREVFADHRPAVVFHAAAYKHVGLMESNPVEAVRNNALATRVMARVAGDAGVRTFILVSTDKAVEPATVMGASKALAEWAVEAADARFPGDPLRQRALRQRARLLGLRGADLPAPDRGGRAGHGHRPGDDALLHDDPGGGAARHPLRLARRGRRGVRARDGRGGLDPRAGEGHDPPLGPAAGPRHRDRDRRPARRREAPRGALQPLRAPAADPGAADPARRAPAHRPRLGRGNLRPRRPAHARGRPGRARRGRRPAREPAARAGGARRPDLVARG